MSRRSHFQEKRQNTHSTQILHISQVVEEVLDHLPRPTPRQIGLPAPVEGEESLPATVCTPSGTSDWLTQVGTC